MPAVLRPLADLIARHARDEEGSIAIEAVIILPVLVLFYLTSFTFYDAYRKQTVITKGGYTIADMLSRQDGSVDAAYIDGVRDVFQFITNGRDETYIRVSRVTRFVDTTTGIDEYRVDASYATGDNEMMTAEELDLNLRRVPVLTPNTTVTVVETYTPYVPPFFIGLDAYVMESYVVTPQRSGLPITLNVPAPGSGSGGSTQTADGS